MILVATFMIVLFGLLCLAELPRDLLPAANLPAVQILTFYPGMSVDRVDQSLTRRFELYTGQAIGVERQESKSLVGVSVVKNFFGGQTDLNTAISQTTSLVMSVLRRLPPGTQPPLILPFDPMAATPLALVAVSGDFPEKVLYDKARYEARNTIQAVPGAMAPTVMGGSMRQVVVYLDPEKLSRFNFSPLDVIEKLSRLNTFVPSGDIKIDSFDYQIVSNGLVDKVEEMNDFPLRAYNGVPVYLKQVGQARDAAAIQTNVVSIDGKRQVYVPVYRQPGANSIRVVDEVKKGLAALEKRLPGFKITLVADQSKFIRHAISSITEEALIGGGLAALLILLFLGNPRATGGILLSLPISILVAFVGLKISNQSINAMTLGGLALSIGVLVDNSIVVLENISKKLEAHLPPFKAALHGASEVALPVLASTLATMVVFFPILFLTGIVKTLFTSLAASVVFAMLGSYVAAMTVMPLFAAYVLRVNKPREEQLFLFRICEDLVTALTQGYGALLTKALRWRKQILAATIFMVLLSTALVPHIGTELFPRADAGNFILDMRLKSGTRIEKTEEFATEFEKKLKTWIPSHDLKMVISNAGVYYGYSAAFTPNSGPQDVFFNVELTEDRDHSSQYYAKIIRQKIAEAYPDVDLGVELGGLLTSALNGGLRSPIDVQIQGPHIEKAHALALDLANKMKRIRGAVDVRVQQRLDSPRFELKVDREKSAELGLTTDEVVKNVVSAVSGSSTFNPAIWVDPQSGIDYLVGVQFDEKELANKQELEQIPITGRQQDRSVPLSRLASVTESTGPSETNHVNLRPVIDIFADAQGRDIGGVSFDVQKLIRETNVPAGYEIDIRGEVSEMQKSVGSLGGGFLLAAILVYLILVVQFRSFKLPTIIMSTVPMGAAGIITMLALTQTYFSIQAAIGAIFMIGIAVANGVLLIEFISHMRLQHADLDQAIAHGSMARLRPILMTSMASILGLVPMALGLGRGSEANIPLGRAVIGGQLVATALTLFVVPILYRLLAHNDQPNQVATSSEAV